MSGDGDIPDDLEGRIHVVSIWSSCGHSDLWSGGPQVQVLGFKK